MLPFTLAAPASKLKNKNLLNLTLIILNKKREGCSLPQPSIYINIGFLPPMEKAILPSAQVLKFNLGPSPRN